MIAGRYFFFLKGARTLELTKFWGWLTESLVLSWNWVFSLELDKIPVFPGSEERVVKVERWDNFGTEKPDLLCYDEFWKSVPLLIMGLKFRAEFFPPLVKLLCSGDVRILIIEQIKIRFKGEKYQISQLLYRNLSGRDWWVFCVEKGGGGAWSF